MSSVKEYVTQFVDEFIDKNILVGEVHRFLKYHERKHILIDNLSRELLKAEYKSIRMDILLLKQVSFISWFQSPGTRTRSQKNQM